MSYQSAWHTARRLPYASLALASIALLIAALPCLTRWLQYDRSAIAAGELWRLWSGHWTHVSGEHLFWDVLMFVVLGSLCELEHRGRCITCVIGATSLIPAVLWFCMPSMLVYRGLSGIDSALFTFLATTHWLREYKAQSWGWMAVLTAICMLFGAKVVYEATTASTLFVHSHSAGMTPVPLAHAIGALVGVGVGVMKNANRQVCSGSVRGEEHLARGVTTSTSYTMVVNPKLASMTLAHRHQGAKRPSWRMRAWWVHIVGTLL